MPDLDGDEAVENALKGQAHRVLAANPSARVVLGIWTVYSNPSDHPGKYVVRLWTINQGTLRPLFAPDAAVFDTLAQARAAIPKGLFRYPRQADDDPVIVESWL